MALRITKASEPIKVEQIVMTVYAVPGIGKTSTACTAESCLLLDFDNGSYRAKNRGDVVQVAKWEDVTSITADDLKGYKTLAVDTAGRALDALTAHIIRQNPKAGNRNGALSLQGYGELKSVFTTWTKLIRSFGLDVVLLSHSDEQKNGDDVNERLDIQGGSKNEIYKASDAMGRLYLRNGKRFLNFSPSDTAFGKNPAGLSPIEVPDFGTGSNFLAGVITQTKAALNAMSVEQTAAVGLLDEWQIAVNECDSPDDFTGLVEQAKGLDSSVRDNAKKMLVKAAKAKGYTFDKKAGAFAAPSAAA
jgi:hypothetical protein